MSINTSGVFVLALGAAASLVLVIAKYQQWSEDCENDSIFTGYGLFSNKQYDPDLAKLLSDEYAFKPWKDGTRPECLTDEEADTIRDVRRSASAM
jgi:hypothetical protein